MDRERQTLELLQLLGDDVAEVVLSRLQPERATMLRSGLRSDKKQSSTIGRQKAVLDEFDRFFQFALMSLPKGSLEALGIDDSGAPVTTAGPASTKGQQATANSSVSGKSNAGDAAAESDTEQNEEAAAAEDENSPSAANDEPESAPPQLTGDPIHDLQMLSIHQLSLALSSEQPKTCAILLSNLPAKLAGDILSLLKSDHQKLVMRELTKEQHAPEVLVERIAKATFIRASQLPADPPDTRDHADRVAEVLRSVPKAGRRNMLAVIEEQDPELAKSLLTRIYRFDDIATLGKTVIQRVLGEIDSTNLTTALYQADQAVTDAVFANLSKRARQTIEEEMQFMSNISESRIKQARDSIAEIIAKLDMESES